MTKLKTLKDLREKRRWILSYVHTGQMDLTQALKALEDLDRQEAIKWVKMIKAEREIKKISFRPEVYFKQFFNLTEEDLEAKK